MSQRESLLIENTELIAEEKLAAMIEEQKPSFEKGIEEIIKMKYSTKPEWIEKQLEKELPKVVEKEIEFCKEVIRLYELWSKEENVLVLWDIDETIGKGYRNPANEGKYEWHFRPSFTFLVEYLKENYPNVKNGILSTGSVEYLDKIRGAVEPFFAEAAITSLAESRIVSAQKDRIENAAREITGENNLQLTDGEAMKLGVLFEMQAKGLNVKNIDDGESAFVMGTNGLNVWNLIPNL